MAITVYGMEIEDCISDQILELGLRFGIQFCKAVAFQHVLKRGYVKPEL